MVAVFDDPRDWGSGSNGISAPEVAAYQQAAATPVAQRTAQQTSIVNTVEAKFARTALSWNEIQRAISAEILAFAASLQSDLTRVLRQHAGPGRERAESEMFSVITTRLVEQQRLLLELRERVEALGG